MCIETPRKKRRGGVWPEGQGTYVLEGQFEALHDVICLFALAYDSKEMSQHIHRNG